MRIRTLFVVALVAITALCQAQVERVKDVIYLKKGGIALTMDVFKPVKPNGIAVIHLVSGGWVSDHNRISPEMGGAYAARGITMFQVVHGATPKYTVMEIIEHIHRAVRFVRANAGVYGIDPNRIGITGGSAGGHLSLIIATKGGPGNASAADLVDRASSQVQSVGIFFPPTDMLNYGKDGAKAFDLPALRIFWPAFGVTTSTTPERAEQLARDFSPIYSISAKTPPVFIVHGDADTLVPIQQSQAFVAKMKSMGLKADLLTVPGKGHGWPEMPTQMMKIVEWFEQTLKK